MPKTRLISPGSIPNHKLLKNLQLQDNYLSNDGGDEGIRITDDGKVGVNTNIVPPISNFEVFNTNVQLDGGATAYQSSTSIVSIAGDFTSSMVGSRFIFDDGTDAGIITSYTNANLVTVSTSQTVGSLSDQRAFKVYYPDFHVDVSGNATKLEIGNMTLDSDELDISTGDFTIDCAGDITLDAGGADVNFTVGGTNLLNWNGSNGLTMKNISDTDDYFRINTATNGQTTMSTVDDSGANDAYLLFQPQGDITLTPAANKDLKATITQKTASGTLDSTFRLTETLDLSSGAGGSDVHYGIWYTQTQTNIGGWDNVYLMYIDGGTDKVFSIDAAANTSIDGRLTIDTITEVGSDTDKFLISDSGTVKYVTGANLLSYIGAQATVTAGTNCTFAGATLNVDDAFIKNDADDTMAGKLTVDVDFTGTTSQSSKGLYVDYDATGDTGSGQNIGNIAVQASVNSSSQTNAGTITNYGVYSVATGGTSGTQTSIGGYFKATGADSNYALVTDGGNVGIGTLTPDTLLTVDGVAKVNSLKLYEDGSNYVDFDVAADGELTIATTGTDADVTITAAGDMNLVATNQDIWFYSSNNYTNSVYFDLGATPAIQLRRDSNNRATIGWDDDGAVEISTTDSDAAEGHLKFDIDGHVEFEGCGVGFDRISYNDAADVTVDFRTGNKAHLDMTGGSITGTLTLQFPAISGNFLLVIEQDGSTRTVNAWATKDAAGNAGNNDGGTGGAIRWSGGSAPDLTDGGSKRDIISFYWDADEEVCYGVASLNF